MNKKVCKKVIKLLTMVILMGTMVIWIMMPTSTYSKLWLTTMRAKLGKSIYYGKPGVNLVVYMFPMILLAFLGCIYLHLNKDKFISGVEKKKKKKKKRDKFGGLRRPMVVKGPLGIVTVSEVMFLTMFMVLLLWSLTNYFYYTFVTITPQSPPIHGDKYLWQARLDSIAVKLGVAGNICLAFLFYPVARGSSLLAAIGLTSESSIKYHIWLGHLTMTLFTSHGLCYVIYWISNNQLSQMLEWDRTGISNLAGEISLVAGLVMWATTFPSIRRRFFEIFFYTHYLYILFFLFFVFHVGISYSLISFPGFYIFILDRFLRFLQSRNNVKLLSARVLPCQTVELNFSKSPTLMYSPTSTMFVNIGSISKLQWHPFTISSSSKLEPETLSVIIRSNGDWSTKLYHMLSSSSSAYHDQIDQLAVSVEGPYGPSSLDFLRHESLVMVSGGSGITPFISIIRDLIYMSSTNTFKIPKLTLICVFKNSSDLSMLDLIQPISGFTTDISSSLDIQIKAFVTREKEPNGNNRNIIKTLVFKPNIISDQPISPILGPNSWLCLAAILSSSFIIFLIIIGIITRYHIYSIDQSPKKYTSAYKSLIYLLALTVSVVATSTIAMLCNKTHYNSKNDQNVDASMIESQPQPQQLLLQSTNIHYGERPNLNKLLVGLKGSSVGVFVCGPIKLQQEVAKICSFGSAHNLQFETISFNW